RASPCRAKRSPRSADRDVMAAVCPSGPTCQDRRMGRAGRRVLIGLVVLVILLVAADRIGLWVAERTAAQTIQDSQDLPQRPAVGAAGSPFLAPSVAGHFGKVTVAAPAVPVGQGNRALSTSQVHVVLHQVSVARDFSRVSADTADATAAISYAELSQPLG